MSGRSEGFLSLQRSTPGSRTFARGIVIAQARVGKAAAVDAPVAKAARAGALLARANTHTHPLTLPAKAEHAGAMPCTQAQIH